MYLRRSRKYQSVLGTRTAQVDAVVLAKKYTGIGSSNRPIHTFRVLPFALYFQRRKAAKRINDRLQNYTDPLAEIWLKSRANSFT